jgi:hypothetical protein
MLPRREPEVACEPIARMRFFNSTLRSPINRQPPDHS